MNSLPTEAIKEFKDICKSEFNLNLDMDTATKYANKVMSDLLSVYHAPIMTNYYATKRKLQQKKLRRIKQADTVN